MVKAAVLMLVFTLDKRLCLNETLLVGNSGGWAKESNIKDGGTSLSPLHTRTHTHRWHWARTVKTQISVPQLWSILYPSTDRGSHGAVNILLTLLTHYLISIEHTGLFKIYLFIFHGDRSTQPGHQHPLVRLLCRSPMGQPWFPSIPTLIKQNILT